MILPLRDYQHPTAGFRLPLPAEWESVEDTDGVALIVVEPDRGTDWFRPNLVVTIEQLATPDLIGWQEQAVGMMRQILSEFLPIDREELTIDGRPAVRLLAHHRVELEQAAAAVAMEQWSTVVGEYGYTLTGSVAALEYADLADTFVEAARQLRPDPGFTI